MATSAAKQSCSNGMLSLILLDRMPASSQLSLPDKLAEHL
jgi:hypothetical protein